MCDEEMCGCQVMHRGHFMVMFITLRDKANEFLHQLEISMKAMNLMELLLQRTGEDNRDCQRRHQKFAKLIKASERRSIR